MEICPYREEYKQQIINLVLYIQNQEAKIDLSLEEQPDLLNVPLYYENKGGEFWTAVQRDEVIGTIGIMNYGKGNAVLKKFFVRSDFRSRKIGFALYKTALSFLKENGFRQILLDTPSAARESHRFYEKAGFVRISKDSLPFHYEYPDRDSYLYLLKLVETD